MKRCAGANCAKMATAGDIKHLSRGKSVTSKGDGSLTLPWWDTKELMWIGGEGDKREPQMLCTLGRVAFAQTGLVDRSSIKVLYWPLRVVSRALATVSHPLVFKLLVVYPIHIYPLLATFHWTFCPLHCLEYLVFVFQSYLTYMSFPLQLQSSPIHRTTVGAFVRCTALW